MGHVTTIAIVEDHPLVRDGMSAACADVEGWTVVFSGESVEALLELSTAPNVVILDLNLSGRIVGVDDVRRIIDRGSRILVVSALTSPEVVRRLLRTGVSGFASKHEETSAILEAVTEVAAGGDWTSSELAAILAGDPERPELSERERRALTLYASGLKMQSVARLMDVKPATVKEYIERVRAKYAEVGRPAPTKVHLAKIAEQDGLLD